MKIKSVSKQHRQRKVKDTGSYISHDATGPLVKDTCLTPELLLQAENHMI